LLVLALLAPAAHATPPGANGKIAFSIFGDIYTVEPDGSGLRQIVRPGAEDGKLDWYPAWSPDGTMLATYGNETERDQWGTVMNIWETMQVFRADGSGFRRFETPCQHFSGQASWSPYGDEIVYVSDVVGNSSVYIVGADGSNPRVLVPGVYDAGSSDPAWSP